jgi:inhibitor of KinA sporulation pathway (predicted exonuclease)
MPRLKTTASPIFDEWPQASVDPVVIFDTEFTAWPDSKTTNWSGENEWREIVQIGAVRIDPVSLQELGSFSMLALPMRNPILSDYFVKLTGIRQVDLDMAAKQYRQVLADFAKFVGKNMAISNGDDASILRENCLFNGIVWPFADHEQFCNAGPWLRRRTGLSREECVSGELPERLGYPKISNAHTGLGDARAIAVAIRHIQRHAAQPMQLAG